MPFSGEPVFLRFLLAQLAEPRARRLGRSVSIHPQLVSAGEEASRAEIALAMNLLLLDDLTERVPTGRAYLADLASAGRLLTFDHGALRTVDLPGMGTLPPGEKAITRILEPLGYRRNEIYPLDRLGMTGRSYTHRDLPEDLPQFFVSELHPARFSKPFLAAVERVTASSHDPLNLDDLRRLERLRAEGRLPFDEASALLPNLVRCFARQHGVPALADYELLAAESAEMAWIATEGNAFNHATDRVEDVDAVVAEQRRRGRPLKDKIEVSRSGRIKQTAFKADLVERAFRDADGRTVQRQAPGSFFEFIERSQVPNPDGGSPRLDLSFDSGNAQGIFKMTAVA